MYVSQVRCRALLSSEKYLEMTYQLSFLHCNHGDFDNVHSAAHRMHPRLPILGAVFITRLCSLQLSPRSQRVSWAERSLIRSVLSVPAGDQGWVIPRRSPSLTLLRTHGQRLDQQCSLHVVRDLPCADRTSPMRVPHFEHSNNERGGSWRPCAPHHHAKGPKRSKATRSILGLKSFAFTTRLSIIWRPLCCRP